MASFPVAGTAEPGELWEYLHRIGSAQLPANCATVTGHPQQLQAPAAGHCSLHDLWEHQSASSRPQPPLSPDEHFPNRAK